MVNIFPGYKLDIFSFRQKDNKVDRRVNEFFGSLKSQPGSKFKDGFRSYFGINYSNRPAETVSLKTPLNWNLRYTDLNLIRKISSK
jgi:hypothetical protein